MKMGDYFKEKFYNSGVYDMKTKEMMRGYTGLFEHIASLQKQLEYQVAMNQNLPNYMFPTAIDSKLINPNPLNQVIRPVAVTFEA